MPWGTPKAGGAASGTTLTIDRPADLATGDLLVIALRSQDASGSVPWSVPGTYTAVSAAPILPSAGWRVGGVWVRRITDIATEPAKYTFTGPNGRSVGVAVAFKPTTQGDIVQVGAAAYGGNTTSGGIVNVNARTLTAAPALSLLVLAAECTAGISHVPSQIPAGYTTVATAQHTLTPSTDTAGTRTAIWLGYRDEATTAVPALSGGFAGAPGAAAYTGSFTGGVLAPPAPIGVPVKLGDGTTAYLSHLNGAGQRVAPASVRMVMPPFTVNDMLATPGVTMGHRGASAVPGMPEMSRRAYRYAATKRGYPMLEISVGRTSDGVYVGIHDASPNRTSQTPGLANVADMTWAQMQALMNSLNAAGSPVPYARLDDLLDEFAPEHTLHVDPKYAGGSMQPFLDVLSAHASPENVVVKFVGTGGGAIGVANAARARGFLAAGYMYQADWESGVMAAEQQYWDILGINYDASVDAFARGTTGAHPGIRSYGKPVVVHIIPTQAAYNLAQSKIAEGGWLNGAPGHTWIAQVSAVDLVAPVS